MTVRDQVRDQVMDSSVFVSADVLGCDRGCQARARVGSRRYAEELGHGVRHQLVVGCLDLSFSAFGAPREVTQSGSQRLSLRPAGLPPCTGAEPGVSPLPPDVIPRRRPSTGPRISTLGRTIAEREVGHTVAISPPRMTPDGRPSTVLAVAPPVAPLPEAKVGAPKSKLLPAPGTGVSRAVKAPAPAPHPHLQLGGIGWRFHFPAGGGRARAPRRARRASRS